VVFLELIISVRGGQVNTLPGLQNSKLWHCTWTKFSQPKDQSRR